MTSRCNYQPKDSVYGPCTREKGHDGPCAHPFAEKRDNWLWLILVLAGTIAYGFWQVVTWPFRFLFMRVRPMD